MEVILQTLGIAGQAAGIALLYLNWRTRQGRGGAILAAGWTLILLGMAPWLLNVSVERGLAIASLAPMVVGLLLSAPNGLTDLKRNLRERPARSRTMRETALSDAEIATPGRVSRNMARWAGAVVATPALSIAAMAAWQASMPGTPANRVGFSIFVLIVVWVAALLWLLASERPWRTALLTCGGAVVLGGGVFILASGGTA
ncbi:hypothetical protein HAD_10545 [Hyphomonas adhaerens MHS-3]|uniref:Uncharacterized protein n=1 Tax=Hyphomonas adhaerens MHS-3 TaxID=1280949 RepID=A0A069E7N8_9PROT|nr:hypothetical protein [Hyphomonas adhaerens]KCZ86118.1 hypothetical protein HAD_10545 [Hyphomonas adhaerens MHS-3]